MNTYKLQLPNGMTLGKEMDEQSAKAAETRMRPIIIGIRAVPVKSQGAWENFSGKGEPA
jgi:hypothetical protein